jgi:hypothetical protein
LLTLAGLVAKPERHDLVKMAKAFRRAEREAAKAHDRRAIEQAGLRVQRRAPVFAPPWLEPPKPEDLDERPRRIVLSNAPDCGCGLVLRAGAWNGRAARATPNR